MYNINDCILIRKTNVFPKNNIIETPIHGLAYSFGRSSILGDALTEKLREKYKDMNDFLKELKKYDIYYETYRRTIHFTINGVVSNSLYGQFNYPYAIIEPLKYHINEESLLGLRVEDTYFTDDIKLSNEAIILIPEEEAIKLEEEYGFTNLNIKTYKGNIEDAIKKELTELGYDFFVVNDHGYRDGLNPDTKDSEMYTFIYDYSKEHGISQVKHFYSDINHEDQMIRLEEGEKIDLEHLEYILNSGLVSDELIEKINNLLDNRMYYKNEFNQLMTNLIDEIGLDNLLFLTKEFNNIKLEERNLKIEKNKRL